jgi:hypothetical protein
VVVDETGLLSAERSFFLQETRNTNPARIVVPKKFG